MSKTDLSLESVRNARSDWRMFERFIECVSDILHVYDPAERRLIFIGHQIEHILGYSPEELTIVREEALETRAHRLRIGRE